MKSLAGIKVLDWTRLLPGPFATMVLGDLGAQVDKLEDLQGADYLRHIPPLLGDTSSMFLALNRNKRSACLDLKKPSARDAFLALARHYDVLVEQFRPGVLERLGVSHATLLAANPRLVICALTGYGQTGPLAKRAGHDLNYLARAGVLGFQGPTNGPPAVPAVQMADIGGGLWCVVGILSALAEREKTGCGQVVDIAMMEASMPFAISSFGLGFGGTPPRRGDEPLTGGIAPYNTYATKDGRAVALAALEPKFWMAFCAGVGLEPQLEALVPGPHQTALKEKLSTLFLQKTRDEWAAFGAERDCCLEPVLEPDELARDPHHVARGVFFTMPSPWGDIPQMRTPLTEAGATHRPPPRTGEHTEDVLREAGLRSEEIARLRSEGAIG
jgi:alpha-methylacyl-CoA racemase